MEKWLCFVALVDNTAATPPHWTHAKDLVTRLPGHPTDLSLGVQFSGYASVSPGSAAQPLGDSLFYWFVGARTGNYWERPTVLWTNGGPGSSSFWGFFSENGPYLVEHDGDKLMLVPRPHAWSDLVNFLIVEHPLNVTFSMSTGPLPHSVEEAMAQWHNAVRNIVGKHPELTSMPWLIAGESYGGTYIPLLARNILAENERCQNRRCTTLSLRAIVVVDGWVDPLLQMATQTIEYAYTHGLISLRQRTRLDAYWRPRNYYCGGLGEGWNTSGYCAKPGVASTATVADEVQLVSGMPYMANIARVGDPSMEPVRMYLNQPEVREALHVPKGVPPIEGFTSQAIWQLWGLNQFKSVSNVLDALLEDGLQVIKINGLNDAKDCGFLGVAAYLDTLTGEVAHRFHEAETRPWRAAVRLVDFMRADGLSTLPAAFVMEDDCPDCCEAYETCERTLGFIQTADDGGLSFVKVLGAGHLAVADQPLIIDLVLNLTGLMPAPLPLPRVVFS